MKKLTFFLAFLFVASMVMAQVQTVHDPNITPTVTNEQIKAWGEASKQNAGSTIILDFEGVGNLADIGNYYNGGTGPNYGVYFSAGSWGLVDYDAGGTGNIANEPSPNTCMFFLNAGDAKMNVPAGFTTGFSFFYSANTSNGFVTVYDGLDGTGNVLATLALPLNYDLNCGGDPTGQYCHWDPIGVSFAGTAKSVVFGGSANYIVFDDVTFGSATPGTVPTLSQWGLIILGLTLLGFGTFYIMKMRG